jgi:hypothetical protein
MLLVCACRCLVQFDGVSIGLLEGTLGHADVGLAGNDRLQHLVHHLLEPRNCRLPLGKTTKSSHGTYGRMMKCQDVKFNTLDHEL